MSKYIVTVTPMQQHLGPETTIGFDLRREAAEYFMRKCDELGYHYIFSAKTLEAGGIGHDYRITLTIEETTEISQ